eukprot:TRINITY_DN460_c2_g1_i6.p1 TRINITY_DN460_c2_g1~~TRINITY_DN460_c2_g1_i6.p1  ORF type:complete len:475 (+),score=86.72 TRINITY_DN460_c2_g1_i6:96-1520(+)
MKHGQKVERTNLDQTTPLQFWEKYISQRLPVLIEGQLLDEEWKAGNKWTDEYLLTQAGNQTMLVEWRDNPSEPFGKGRKVRMTVGDFIKQIKDGNENYYLTSNMQIPEEDGHPQLFQAPLTYLRSDFCLRPELLGNLIPQQLNLWWGAAKHGSSTGLHHDFHDNLYVLLRGRKRFTLFPPTMANKMYTNGEMCKLYPNGRIVYKDQEFVNADGSVPSETQQTSQLNQVEQRIAQLEEQVKKGVSGAQKELEEAEEELEKLLEQELDYNKDLNAGMEVEEDDGKQQQSSGDVEVDENDPPSFSKVDINVSPEIIKQQFPKFPSLKKAMVCDVSEGQMLYIPAGWFHEVKSFSSNTEESKNGHMAFNFWFHPPDNLQSNEEGFSKPYMSDYWPIIWEKRRHLYEYQGTIGGAGSAYGQLSSVSKSRNQGRLKKVVKYRKLIQNVENFGMLCGVRRPWLNQIVKRKKSQKAVKKKNK